MKPSDAKIYVVTMYRGGNRERHSYVLGVFSTQQRAITAARRELSFRSGKYVPEILEMLINNVSEAYSLPLLPKDFPIVYSYIDYFEIEHYLCDGEVGDKTEEI